MHREGLKAEEMDYHKNQEPVAQEKNQEEPMKEKSKTNGNVVISDDSEAMDSSLWSQLPPELVNHVLFLLPVKSLCRFKAISPSWNTFISSPQFAQTHLHITNVDNNPTNKPHKTILIPYSSPALYSVDDLMTAPNPTAEKLFFPFAGQIMVLGYCHDLLLVRDIATAYDSIFLWNPSTRECKQLPKYPTSWANWRCDILGVGYDSSTDDYKVVMLLRRIRCGDVNKAGVYSLKSDSWKVASQVADYDYHETDFAEGFYFNERLHCVTDQDSLTCFPCGT